MELIVNPKVKDVFDAYPDAIKQQLLHLRTLILSTASEVEGLQKLEETLKWGEPSYVTKHGSTVRIDWKKKHPDQIAMYFKCTSKLVPTFKQLYSAIFEFEGNRALIFKLGSNIREKELKNCIAMALAYHKIKHLPLLGA